MSERIPDARWSEAEQALLAAARGERMPAEIEARMREALDFPKPAIDVDAAASSSLYDSVNIRPLFAGKLSLWGSLSVLVLGAISYYALRPTASPPSAATRPQHDASEEAAFARQPASSEELTASAHAGVAIRSRPAEGFAARGAADSTEPAEATNAVSAKEQAASPRAAAGEEPANAPSWVKTGEQRAVPRDAALTERQVAADQGGKPRRAAGREAALSERGVAADQGGNPWRAAGREAALSERRVVADQGGNSRRAAGREAALTERQVAADQGGNPRRAAGRDAALSERGVAADERGDPRRAAFEHALAPGSTRIEQRDGDAKSRRSTVVQSGPSREQPLQPSAAGGVTPPARIEATDELRIEARWLEQARRALARAALPEARQWLARYRARFAHGALQPESQVLEIELKIRTGARTSAQQDADNFLAQHPQHPLRERVERLTHGRP